MIASPRRRLCAAFLFVVTALTTLVASQPTTCPLRVAFMHSDFIKWPSHRISTTTWKLSLGHHVQLDTNPASYESYHVLLVMARDKNLTMEWVESVRLANPKLIVGFTKAFALDLNWTHLADFGIVDNSYLGELFIQHGISPLRLPTIELLNTSVQAEPYLQPFTTNRPARICYQGNRMHLESMLPDIIPAINEVSKSIPLELWVITSYSTTAFQAALKAMMTTFRYHIIYYDDQTVHTFLSQCDLGLVPQSDDSGIELRNPTETMAGLLQGASELKQLYGRDWFGDGIMLHKRSANAGRAYAFLRFGVPVIADAAPHIIEKLRPNNLGYVLERRSAYKPFIAYFLSTASERKTLAANARDFSSKYLTTYSMGLSFVDYLIETFDDRIPSGVVKDCKKYLEHQASMGAVFESIKVPKSAWKQVNKSTSNSGSEQLRIRRL